MMENSERNLVSLVAKKRINKHTNQPDRNQQLGDLYQDFQVPNHIEKKTRSELTFLMITIKIVLMSLKKSLATTPYRLGQLPHRLVLMDAILGQDQPIFSKVSISQILWTQVP
ncbi:hypothetical protein BLNAU_16088 [Blattamonas nauphoetae]|uniref:Uncharacterized protein n=1 Tax=Blattamonas nauphoetae TaxID=2049346 RepID=A0ABQ9X8T9_9EUKA|nr:hypothetical protein BLNAU_16088 [Blattamonas nauphoetae]